MPVNRSVLFILLKRGKLIVSSCYKISHITLSYNKLLTTLCKYSVWIKIDTSRQLHVLEFHNWSNHETAPNVKLEEPSISFYPNSHSRCNFFVSSTPIIVWDHSYFSLFKYSVQCYIVKWAMTLEMVGTHGISCLFSVRVVPKRTFMGDLCFDNLGGSHLQN